VSSVKAFILSLLLETLSLFLYSYAKFHGLWFETAAFGLCVMFFILGFLTCVTIGAEKDPRNNTETFNARRVRKDICK
jgi:hypothetical protein